VEPIRVCLLGLTHPHSTMHLTTLQTLDLAKSIVLCPDEGEAVPPEMAQAGKVARALDGIEELLGRADIPVVFVVLRNSRVREAAVRLIAAGKHLFCEKPMGRCADDARAILDAAAQKKVQVSVCFPFRYHPSVREIRGLVQAGALGRIVQVEARMVTSQVRLRDPKKWLFHKQESGGGILSWLGCHWLDLLQFVLNDEVAAVAGAAETLSGEGISVEDCACMSFRFRNGAIGSLTAGYLLPVSRPGYQGAAYDSAIRIWGTQGRIVWDGAIRQPNFMFESIAPEWHTAPQREMRFTLGHVPAYGGAHGLEFVRDFFRATRGECPPPTTADDALRIHRILDAAYRSSAERREVAVS